MDDWLSIGLDMRFAAWNRGRLYRMDLFGNLSCADHLIRLQRC